MLELPIFQLTKAFKIFRCLMICCFLIAILLGVLSKNNIFWANISLGCWICSFLFLATLIIIKKFKQVGLIIFNQSDFIVNKNGVSKTFTYFDIETININCYNNYFIGFISKYSDGYGNYIKIVASGNTENYFLFVEDLKTFTKIRIHFDAVKTTMPYINNWKFKLR